MLFFFLKNEFSSLKKFALPWKTTCHQTSSQDIYKLDALKGRIFVYKSLQIFLDEMQEGFDLYEILLDGKQGRAITWFPGGLHPTA